MDIIKNDVFRIGPQSPLSDEQQSLILSIKLKAGELYDLYMQSKNSRELSIACTELEYSVMWAVKCITAK